MKGIEGKLIVELILVVVVIVIAVLLLLTQGGPEKWPWVWAIFNTVSGTYNQPAATKLEAVMRCSYYSCDKGCSAPEIQDLSVFVNGQTQNCKDICQSHQTNGKMCGSQNPLVATVSNADGEVLSDQETGICDYGVSQCASEHIGANIQTDIIKPQTITASSRVDCTESNNIGKAIILNGKYNVWSEHGIGLPGQSATTTVVCSSTVRPQSNACILAGGTCQPTECTNVYLPQPCPQEGYFCCA